MIKSPKEKFQSSQVRTSQWAQIVANPLFDEACDAALLQLLTNMPQSQEMAAAMHLQMIGAEAIIRILKTIHEKSEQPKERKYPTLNSEAGI